MPYEQSKFCYYEGMTNTQKKNAPKAQHDTPNGSPAVSRAALALGILAVLLILSPLAYLLGIFAIILGATSLKTSNKRIAIAGIILGLLAVVLASAARMSV